MADNMTPEQRSATMSRIRSRDTNIEMRIRRRLHRRGHRYRVHAKWLPGSPDVVFTRWRVAVFIDGDFWHGYRFHEWQGKLAPQWRDKISRNRQRDRVRREELRSRGWNIVQMWEHEVKENVDACVQSVEDALDSARAKVGEGAS
jgi:DNA mismatch endonuclease (patch repair protein)